MTGTVFMGEVCIKRVGDEIASGKKKKRRDDYRGNIQKRLVFERRLRL